MAKKKNFRGLFILLIVLSWLATGCVVWWLLAQQPVCRYSLERKECPEVLLMIEKGDGLSLISAKLKEKKLIRNTLAFNIFALAGRYALRFQAGDFYLSSADSLPMIARALTKGTADKKITLIEGWRLEEIGEYLNKQGFSFDLKKWRSLILQADLEGSLFPDTYFVPKAAAPERIVEILTKNFNLKFNQELEKAALTKGMDKQSVLILASLIEREIHREEDRPIVAGILLKRIASGWPLQVDATVQYAVSSVRCKLGAGCDWWPKKISQSDLKIISPFNTYLNRGLPPAPICNPGLSAVRAVIYSQESPFWYYLSDKNGETRFAKTNEEHSQNIRQYLQ